MSSEDLLVSSSSQTLSAARRHKSIKKNKRIYSSYQDHPKSVKSTLTALSSLFGSINNSKVLKYSFLKSWSIADKNFKKIQDNPKFFDIASRRWKYDILAY